jgi:hypothetical protein
MPEADSIIAAIARELMPGDDRRLFRRVVRRHLGELELLHVDEEMDWEQIARKLAARGARHKRGQPISGHQLRTEVSRLKRSIPGRRNSRAVGSRSKKPRPPLSGIAAPPSGDRPGGGALDRIATLTKTRVHAPKAEE